MKLQFEKDHIKNKCSCFNKPLFTYLPDYISSINEIISSSIPFIIFDDLETTTRGISSTPMIDLAPTLNLSSCIAMQAFNANNHHAFTINTANCILLIENKNNNVPYFLQLMFERKCNFLLMIKGTISNLIHIQCDFKYDSSMSIKIDNALSKVSICSIVSSESELYKEVLINDVSYLDDIVVQKNNSICRAYYLMPLIEKHSIVKNKHILDNNCSSIAQLRSFLFRSTLDFSSMFINTALISSCKQSLLTMTMDKESKCNLSPKLVLSGTDNICSHEAFYGDIAEDILSFITLFGIMNHKAKMLFLKGFLHTEKNIFANDIQDIIETYRK